MDKNKRILIIVESPEKSRHITQIFRDAGYNNVVVQATIGHFTEIKDGSGYFNTGIFPNDNFKINYVIDTSKSDNVKRLKEQIKIADFIYVASDLDREGEAIAWSCVKFLSIPKNKYKRITYHEITKKAVFDAIDKAHDIDTNLVNAAHSRACLDKMMGYRLSGIARQSISCKSVGRCQSAALKLICDRENEIINFKPEKYIDLYLKFRKNDVDFKAKYTGTSSEQIKCLNKMEEVEGIFKECKGHDFIVDSVEFKDRLENPKPPFCTATFQQECASKLGLTVKQSMDCAQKLFETGKISYMRTDDEVMDEGFASELIEFVRKNYGSVYTADKVVEGKKDENAQAGHECLRVLDLSLTPDKYAKEALSDLHAKVYKIIYNRTVASAMKPSIVAVTTYTIANGKHRFVMNSNELRFDGYKSIYSYKDDKEDKENIIKETFEKNEILHECSFDAQEKETKPKSRYKEASFIKELKDKGIGRPSTYATIIETIKREDRGYTKVEDKYLVPTDKGMMLSKFLDEKFPDVINLEYTKEMEKSLDLIANGKLDYIEFLNQFYEDLEKSAEAVSPNVNQVCPECGKPLVKRYSVKTKKYFLGCSGYPNCKHIERIK